MAEYIDISILPPGFTWPPEPESCPGDGQDAGGDAPGEGEGEGEGEDRGGSRWNALRDGFRSRVLFPDTMIPLVEKFSAQLAAELKPKGEYEQFFVDEMARASAQLEAASRLEIPDFARFLDRVRLDWPDYRSEAVERDVARLPRAPESAARSLRKSRQGAEYLLEHLRGLGLTVAAKGGLDEEQRQFLFSLMGLPHPMRDNPERCPAGNDAVKLTAVIAEEIRKLERSLELELIARDRAAQRNALNGLPMPADAETRRLKANMGRARRRLEWARGLLEWLRAGGSPVGLVDPETKKPLAEEVAAHAARGRARRGPHGARSEKQTQTQNQKEQAEAPTAGETPGCATAQDEKLSQLDQEALALGGVLMAEVRARRAAPAADESDTDTASDTTSASDTDTDTAAEGAVCPSEMMSEAEFDEAVERVSRQFAAEQKYRRRQQRRKRRR